MAPKGFIQDKLEIKFLILYLAARVIEPVPFDTMLDLTLCDDAIDYFDFSDCLADLVRTDNLKKAAFIPSRKRAAATARSARPASPTPSGFGVIKT